MLCICIALIGWKIKFLRSTVRQDRANQEIHAEIQGKKGGVSDKPTATEGERCQTTGKPQTTW